MAESSEELVIMKICNILSDKFSLSPEQVYYERYDILWFNKYDITLHEHEWVKGASDYIIKIQLDTTLCVLIEIKLKAEEYRKTKSGGITRSGSMITNYGCTSFYIDIVPVLQNMNRFSSKIQISPKAFLIAFAKDDLSEINIISLAKLNDIIKNGWKKNDSNIIDVCMYGEGYGQNTYLVPKDATLDINKLDFKDLEMIAIKNCPKP